MTTLKWIDDLLALEIDDFFITESQMKKVYEILNIEEVKDEKTLREARNTLVKCLGRIETKCIEAHDIEQFRIVNNTLSGCTCAIDKKLFDLGFGV